MIDMISRGDGRGFRTSVLKYQTSATGRDERLENTGLRNTESSGSLTQIDSVAHVSLYMPVVRRETQKEWREKITMLQRALWQLWQASFYAYYRIEARCSYVLFPEVEYSKQRKVSVMAAAFGNKSSKRIQESKKAFEGIQCEPWYRMHSPKGKVAVPKGMMYNKSDRIGEHEAEEALARVGGLGISLGKGSLGVQAHQGTSWHFVMT